VPGVFSSRLYAATVPAGSNRYLAFTVPAGHRVVVRHVFTAATAASGNAVILYVGSGGPEVFRAVPAASSMVALVDTRTTFHEGEQCFVRALTTTAIVALDGFILEGGGGPLTPSSATRPVP
jgi:hypothetical protein